MGAQEQHSEGFQLHGGTIDCTSGEYQPHLAYTYHHGMLRTALLGCNVILRDHKAGDGGFCIVPGSHKANFKMPPGMVEGNAYANYVRQPTTNAGDVILFSEGPSMVRRPGRVPNNVGRPCIDFHRPQMSTDGVILVIRTTTKPTKPIMVVMDGRVRCMIT